MITLALVLALGAATPATALDVVPFASPESMVRLERSRHKVDFFTLANHYEGEQNMAMCGPATAVIVLNALRADSVTRPRDRTLFPAEYAAQIPKSIDPVFPRYTQGTFFDANFTAVKKKEVFYGAPDQHGDRDAGMQLRQLHEVLLRHGLDSRIQVVGDRADEPKMKAEIIENLRTAGDYVIVNYSREALGQNGGGHISPLAAYDDASDSFLVLDVNPNQGKTWVWVPAERLFAAMRTRDHAENRGYLLVREGAGARP